MSFELGGKNPGIVFADCDLDKAVEATMRSVFANCGQVCLGTERVYVERPIFDAFVARLKTGRRGFCSAACPSRRARPMGPLISQEHRKKVLGFYEKAKAEGATLVTGGGIPKMAGDLANGAWIEPTIWTGLPETSPIVREEIFGPCCHIAPFDTEEEAIRLANDTPYGLACSIYTENLARAHRVSARMEVGIVWVNCWFLRDLRTPFGGSKNSGIGREGGVHSLEFYTELPQRLHQAVRPREIMAVKPKAKASPHRRRRPGRPTPASTPVIKDVADRLFAAARSGVAIRRCATCCRRRRGGGL